jgi:hypothetical protein
MNELRFDWYSTVTDGVLYDKALEYADQHLSTLPSKRGVNPEKRQQLIHSFFIQLFSALYSAHYQMPKGDGWVKVPLGNDAYTTSRAEHPNKILGSAGYAQGSVQFLEENNLVEVDRGNENKGYSKVRPVNQLSQLMDSIGFRWMPREVLPADQSIILRDRKETESKFKKIKYTKFTVPLPDTEEIKAEQRIIHTVNGCLQRHCFSLNISDQQLTQLAEEISDKALAKAKDNKQWDTEEDQIGFLDFSRTQIKRIYARGDTKLGGRFYHGWWQHVPSHVRQHIEIDGYKTVEIDFSGMSLRLLYAKEKLSLPLDADVYDLGFSDWQGSDDPRRKIIKKFVNAAFNDENEDYKVDADDLKFLGLKDQEDLRKMFYRKHQAVNIDKHIKQGWGLQSQYLDSEIALRVLYAFALDDVPVLPVHDSFIIRLGYKNDLQQEMLKAFDEVVSGLTKTDITFSKPSDGFGDKDFVSEPRIVTLADAFDEFTSEASLMDNFRGSWKQQNPN